MTRFQEMKTQGYTLRIYGFNNEVLKEYNNVRCTGFDSMTYKWTIYGMHDNNIIDEFELKHFKDFDCITKNKT